MGESEGGYIRVDGPQPPVWLRCDRCGRSDGFSRREQGVYCACGARYGFAVHEGERFELSALTWVPFDQGPAALARWEIAWDRIFLVVVLIGGGGLLYWLMTS